eukprot:9969621-Alexandrium_andersonii.AAC.1
MSASLVGSEMCIRDSSSSEAMKYCSGKSRVPASYASSAPSDPNADGPVSYTHLTLPTICSV